MFVIALGLFAAEPDAKLAAKAVTGDNWPEYGGSPYAWRFSQLNQINTANVHRLKPAWVFQTGDYADALQATPIVLDGVMYFASASNWVFALYAATGKLLWEYRYRPLKVEPRYLRQNRGIAVAQGRVLMGTADNHVVAIDAKTGSELWDVDIEDARYCGCNVTGAPTVAGDNVIVGVTGGDSSHRGYLTAFNIKTGRLAWRFFTIPGPGEPGNETWAGDSWRFGGAPTWLTGSYDPELNLLYWGVGNPAADFDASNRAGANLYTNCIIALNPATGKLVWYRQLIPGDVWDFDASYEIILADLPVEGKPRKLAIQMGKSGFTWVLDRTNGEFITAWPFVQHYNWITGIGKKGELIGRNEPIYDKPKLFCPSAMGGRSWNHAAYSPITNLIYSTGMEVCGEITAELQEVEPGTSWFGGRFNFRPPPNDKSRGFIAAYDPVTGKRAWVSDQPYYMLASMLATAGGLVFTGDPHGTFYAWDARTGKTLWSFSNGAGHRGSPVTYVAGGKQFIATPTGWGSLVGRAFQAAWPGAPLPRAGSTMVAYTLDETVK